MNRLLFLFIAVVYLSSCSQKQFGFRQKVSAGKDLAEKQVYKKHEPVKPVNPKDTGVSYAAAKSLDELPVTDSLAKQKIAPARGKKLLSASTLKEIIPFSIDHLSSEEPEAPELKPQKRNETEGGVFGYISLVFGLLSIFALLSLVFVSSNALGVLLLFSAPVLGAVALILGIMSVTDNNGRGMGWAGIVMGSFILLVTLVMVLVAYLFIQSSIN